jgi:hypothetical protein
VNQRIILSLSAVTVLGLALLPGHAIAQQKALKESIVGSWSVTSVSDHYEDGKKVNPWGAGMKGNLTFDNNGRFTQILIGEKQPAMKSADPRRPDALTVAYFGSYALNEGSKTVTVKVERATNSIRDGADQSWTVTMTGDAMSLVGSARKDEKGTFSPHLEVKRAK